MARQETKSKGKATVNKSKSSKQTPAQRTKANKPKPLKKTPAQRAKESKEKALKKEKAQRAKAKKAQKAKKANSSKTTQSKKTPAAQQAKANNAKSSKQTPAQRRAKAGKASSSKQAPNKRSKARKANSVKQTPAQRAKASQKARKAKALRKVPPQQVKSNQTKLWKQAPTQQTNELTRRLDSLPVQPSERRRIDELPGSSGSYIQHPQHWYPDGNLLLQIDTVRFKLYGGRLATESPFFSALLQQRKGKQDSKPYEYQGEMVQVLSTAQRVQGLDLFFLDPRQELISAPNANEFAVFLTTMNSAVNFAYNLPSFQDVCSIWKTAVFYEMESYKDFCQRYFKDLFPDTWLTISTSPCDIDRAVICARLGAEHSRMRRIRRPAFYDLARTPLFSNVVHNGSDGMTRMKMTKTEKLERRKGLKKLGADNMITLLELQRRLGLKWLDIINLMHIPCVERCTPSTSIKDYVRPICEELPYDPIIGIRRLLMGEEFSSTFCEHTAHRAKKRLRKEGEALWKEFGRWIHEISNNTSDSDSDST